MIRARYLTYFILQYSANPRVVALHDENAENDYTRYLIFVDVSLLVFKFHRK